jgi:hypothetical protein
MSVGGIARCYTTHREIAATLGYANTDHPVRTVVYNWPECKQVVSVPWQEEMRALFAIAYRVVPTLAKGHTGLGSWLAGFIFSMGGFDWIFFPFVYLYMRLNINFYFFTSQQFRWAVKVCSKFSNSLLYIVELLATIAEHQIDAMTYSGIAIMALPCS